MHKRVRQQAWHTIEDGGKPNTSEAIATLERLCASETDPKVRRFAELTMDKVLGSRHQQEMPALKVALCAHLSSGANAIFAAQRMCLFVRIADHDPRQGFAAPCFDLRSVRENNVDCRYG